MVSNTVARRNPSDSNTSMQSVATDRARGTRLSRSEHLRAFLKRVLPEPASGEAIELRFVPTDGGPTVSRWCSNIDVTPGTAFSDLMELRSIRPGAKHGLFYSTVLRRNHDGTKAGCTRTKAIRADIDDKLFPGGHEEAGRAILVFPLLPSVVVDTGGGFHVYYCFPEPIDMTDDPDLMARFERLCRALGRSICGPGIEPDDTRMPPECSGPLALGT